MNVVGNNTARSKYNERRAIGVTNVLGIYVKHPRPGKVKTRLAADVGNDKAAEIYRGFLMDLVSRFQNRGDRRFLCYSPDTQEAKNWFQERGGADYELWPQPEGSLTPRLARFFEFAKQSGASATVVIGSDSPTIPTSSIEQAFEQLKSCDAVLGPATDGGYYLLGLAYPLPIFDAIDWSTPDVFSQTIDLLTGCRANLKLLPPWYDVDTIDDLQFLRGHVAGLFEAKDPLAETLTLTRKVLENLAQKP